MHEEASPKHERTLESAMSTRPHFRSGLSATPLVRDTPRELGSSRFRAEMFAAVYVLSSFLHVLCCRDISQLALEP